MAWITSDWLLVLLGLIIIAFLIWLLFFRKRKKDPVKEIQELTEKEKVFREFEIAERTREKNPDMTPQEIMWKLARPHFVDTRNNPNVLDYNEKEVIEYVRQRPIPTNTGRDRENGEEEQRTGRAELSELPERRNNIQSNKIGRAHV